jgi:hypothetical protein
VAHLGHYAQDERDASPSSSTNASYNAGTGRIGSHSVTSWAYWGYDSNLTGQLAAPQRHHPNRFVGV